MKTCPICHSENPDEAKFCLECGTAFPAGPQEEEVEVELIESSPETESEIEIEPEPQEEIPDEEVVDIFGSTVEGLHDFSAFETDKPLQEPSDLVTEEVLSFEEPGPKTNSAKQAPQSPKPEEKIWYFVENNESKGSFDQSQMKEFLDSGRINPKTYVWKPGFTDWQHLDQTELKSLIPAKEEAKPVEPEPAPTPEIEWYFVENNEAKGPYSQDQMIQMIKNQVLHGDDYVWNEDYVNWTPLAQTPLAVYIPAEQPSQSAAEPVTPNAKPLNTSSLLPHSLLTNLLLWVFTCGIFQYFWIYQETRDINILARQRGLQPMMDPGMVVFLTIITCGLFSIYFYYKAQTLINEIAYPGQNKSTEAILITALAVFIPVFAIVPMCIIQDNINHVIELS